MDLRKKGWLQTVERDPFGEILISGLAVVAIFLATDQGAATPIWLDLDPALSAMCFTLAFQRVRRARQIEESTSHAWDEVTSVWNQRSRGVDAVLEGTYQLGLHVLPFSSLSVTIFLPVLLVTELSTIGHQVLFLRSHRTYFEQRGYVDEPRTEVRELFTWRLRVLLQRVLLAAVLTGVAWSFGMQWRWTGLAVGLGIALLGALVLEPFAAPRHEHHDAQPDFRVRFTEAPQDLSGPERDRLDDIFSRAFPSAGTTAADLVDRIGTDGHGLLVATCGSDPIGLLSLQRDADEVSYLWWIATDSRYRRRGIARYLLAAAAKHLAGSSLILLEADLMTTDGETRAARQALLDVLDARPISGLRWGPTHAPDVYDIYLVPTTAAVGPSSLRAALTQMARFSLRQDEEAQQAALAAIARLDVDSVLAR